MFDHKVDELFQGLGLSQIMVLATSEGNRVTARSMSIIIDSRKLYFQTDKNFCKYRQIKSNANVAVCYNNIQIEGICKEIGHPFEQENNLFTQKYKECFRSSYDKYTHLANETVFVITPILITVWAYDNGKPYREFYDFNREKYIKEYYDISGVVG